MNSVTVTGRSTATPTSKHERFMDHCDLDAPPPLPEPAPDAHLESDYDDRTDIGEVD